MIEFEPNLARSSMPWARAVTKEIERLSGQAERTRGNDVSTSQSIMANTVGISQIRRSLTQLNDMNSRLETVDSRLNNAESRLNALDPVRQHVRVTNPTSAENERAWLNVNASGSEFTLGGQGGALFGRGGLLGISSVGAINPVVVWDFNISRVRIPPAYNSVSNARAVHVNGDGALGTTASTRRVKDVLGAVQMDDAMLKSYVDLEVFGYVEKGDETSTVRLGMGAEDFHEAGFGELVYYDEATDSETPGRIDGLAYERKPVLDHLALRRLLERIEDLEDRLAKASGNGAT